MSKHRRPTNTLDARLRAAEEARRMLGVPASNGLRQNPAAPVDPDLANLASDLEHGFLLSGPSQAPSPDSDR